MFDNVSSPLIMTSASGVGISNPSSLTEAVLYADVLAAVKAAQGVTSKVRANMRSAVTKIAHLMSARGLQGEVIVVDIAKKLERQTAATLGLKTENALAGVKSNLRRALRLAGIDVMPGRHVAPLSPAWQALLNLLDDRKMKIMLSRFAHLASEHGWEPDDIGPPHLARFRKLLETTTFGAKPGRIIRNTITAWAFGLRNRPGWPPIDLGPPPAETRFYALPWSAFPLSFKEDVEAYLNQHDLNLSEDLEDLCQLDDIEIRGGEQFFVLHDDAKRRARPLHVHTKQSYRDAFLRIASILVAFGRPSHDIKLIADLVALPDVKNVIRFMRKRTNKKRGGHIAYLALLVFVAARDHVKLSCRETAKLDDIWRCVREEHSGMSQRSLARLLQFDDPDKMQKMANLPAILASAARRRSKVDAVGIRLMRTATFIAIGLDTALRSGNIVGVTLDRHLNLHRINKGWAGEILVPGDEVKNRAEAFTKLRPATAALIAEWIQVYRPHVCVAGSDYLLCSQSGGHISTNLATESLKSLAAKHAGLDITPHVIRAFIGKVILDENPDAHATVQAALGHASLATTINSYAPLRPVEARKRHQAALERLR